MTLSEIILNCKKYVDSEDYIQIIFAELNENRFTPQSEAVVVEVNDSEAEMKWWDIAKLKCPGFNYFLEVDTVQDFMDDLEQLEEFKTAEAKVNGVIHYKEFDA
jgi:hypothetical protein